MRFEFDPEKNAINRARHGIGLDAFAGFDAEPIVLVDDRFDYDEIRYRAFGRIGGMGYMIVFVVRGEAMRLISFRRAHEKEMQRHDR